MKKIFFLIPILLLISCKSKVVSTNSKEISIEKAESKFVKINNSSIDEFQKTKAYEFGKRILMTCNTSKFKVFDKTEATNSVIKNITQERLTKTCLKFRLRYGDFIDLDLISIYKNTFEKTTVFRFKALYKKKIANKELRLSLNYNNQVSAVQSLDWVDIFQP